MLNRWQPARVAVDPNRVSRRHLGLTPVLLAESPGLAPGRRVLAVQEDEDGSAFVGRARVECIEGDLAYLAVDWRSFTEEVFAPSVISQGGESNGTIARIRSMGRLTVGHPVNTANGQVRLRTA